MGFDLSGIDAELDALGEQPRDLEALAEELARELRTLADVDRALSALADSAGDEGSVTLNPPRPPALPRMELPRTQAPTKTREHKSGEIDLGTPVQRRAEPSSDLTLLDSDRPRSGSFELADQDLRTERNEVDVFASPKRINVGKVAPISLQPDSEPPQVELTPLAVDPLEDEDEQEQKLVALFNEEESEPDTSVSIDERDPDAEFDALFDEATHPSGIPTRSLESDDDSVDAEDLLSGLGAPARGESDALTSALFNDMDLSDATQLTDAKDVAAHLDPFPSEEELGSSEFEIVLDEDGEAKDLVPSRPPDEGTQPGDKRPSFLGRLFGRKDEK